MPFYFAYGSNLDQSQMRQRCPDSRLVGVGSLAQHRLDFTRYSQHWQGGVADVVSDERHEVWGLVYRLSHADLEQLDRFESYPTGYDRAAVTIRLPQYTNFPQDAASTSTTASTTASFASAAVGASIDSLIKSVWVYHVAQKRPFMPPHAKYLGIIQSAADHWNFPAGYRHHLNQIRQYGAAAEQSE